MDSYIPSQTWNTSNGYDPGYGHDGQMHVPNKQMQHQPYYTSHTHSADGTVLPVGNNSSIGPGSGFDVKSAHSLHTPDTEGGYYHTTTQQYHTMTTIMPSLPPAVQSVRANSNYAMDLMYNQNGAEPYPANGIHTGIPMNTVQGYYMAQPQASGNMCVTPQCDIKPVISTKWGFTYESEVAGLPTPSSMAQSSSSETRKRAKLSTECQTRNFGNLHTTPVGTRILPTPIILASQTTNIIEGSVRFFYSVQICSIEKALSGIKVDTNSEYYKEYFSTTPLEQLNLSSLFNEAYKKLYKYYRINGYYEVCGFEQDFLDIQDNGIYNILDSTKNQEITDSQSASHDYAACLFPIDSEFYLPGNNKIGTKYNFSKYYKRYVLAQMFVNAYGYHDGTEYTFKSELTDINNQPLINEENFNNALWWIQNYSGLGGFSDMLCYELALALKKPKVDGECYEILSFMLSYFHDIIELMLEGTVLDSMIFSDHLSMFTNWKNHQNCQWYLPKPSGNTK